MKYVLLQLRQTNLVFHSFSSYVTKCMASFLFKAHADSFTLVWEHPCEYALAYETNA